MYVWVHIISICISFLYYVFNLHQRGEDSQGFFGFLQVSGPVRSIIATKEAE
jgi:hypothetical protein